MSNSDSNNIGDIYTTSQNINNNIYSSKNSDSNNNNVSYIDNAYDSSLSSNIYDNNGCRMLYKIQAHSQPISHMCVDDLKVYTYVYTSLRNMRTVYT